MTSNDLGAAQKTIGLMYSVWGSYMPNMKLVRVGVLQNVTLKFTLN